MYFIRSSIEFAHLAKAGDRARQFLSSFAFFHTEQDCPIGAAGKARPPASWARATRTSHIEQKNTMGAKRGMYATEKLKQLISSYARIERVVDNFTKGGHGIALRKRHVGFKYPSGYYKA
jgi:hypothetical protein